MTKLFGFISLLIGASVTAMASGGNVPEVDAGYIGTAVALLGGGLLVLRARRKH